MAVFGVAGAVGTWLGGFATQYFLKRTFLAPIIVPAVSCLAVVPLMVVGFSTVNLSVMFWAFLIVGVFQTVFLGPMFSVTQSVISVRVRATSIGILLFIINLIGYGLGPPLVGLLADSFTNSYLATSAASEVLTAKCNFSDANLSQVLQDTCLQAKTYGMKIACLIAVSFFFLASLFFLFSGRFLKNDLAQA